MRSGADQILLWSGKRGKWQRKAVTASSRAGQAAGQLLHCEELVVLKTKGLPAVACWAICPVLNGTYWWVRRRRGLKPIRTETQWACWGGERVLTEKALEKALRCNPSLQPYPSQNFPLALSTLQMSQNIPQCI